jgi:hypothetical protein
MRHLDGARNLKIVIPVIGLSLLNGMKIPNSCRRLVQNSLTDFSDLAMKKIHQGCATAEHCAFPCNRDGRAL